MFCDDCGDMTKVARPLIVIYPNNKKTKKATRDLIELAQRYGYDVLEILICPQCWRERFKDSRKRQVASMIRILTEE